MSLASCIHSSMTNRGKTSWLPSLTVSLGVHSRLGATFTLKCDHQLDENREHWLTLAMTSFSHKQVLRHHANSTTWPTLSVNRWQFRFFQISHLGVILFDSLVSRWFWSDTWWQVSVDNHDYKTSPNEADSQSGSVRAIASITTVSWWFIGLTCRLMSNHHYDLLVPEFSIIGCQCLQHV